MASRATVADGYMFKSILVSVLTIGLGVAACYAPDGPDSPFLSGWALSADRTAVAIVGALQVVAHAQLVVNVVRSRRDEAAKLVQSFDELYLDVADKLPTMQFPLPTPAVESRA